jgi:nitrite reductase (NO-forming)
MKRVLPTRSIACVAVALGMSAFVGVPAAFAADATTTTTTPTSATTAAPVPTTVSVRARSYSYTPKRLSLPAGQRVTVQLTSADVRHDFAVSGPGFKSKVIVTVNPKKTATGTLTLPKPGKYTFYCTIQGHRAAGMQGTITAR